MVTVIIVNWNSGKLLEQCLKDLRRQELVPNRILVIDNDSSDGSQNVANIEFGEELQRMDSNLGFAKGNNRAIEQVDTEFVALLNPDAFPAENWLSELVAAAHKYQGAAAFGCRQMIHNGDGLIDGLGDAYHISGLVWRRWHGLRIGTISNTPFEIFSPCAGAALYRTEALREVGIFDEDFFCYVEDVDLGFRLRLAGYKSMLVPSAVVDHVGAATSGGSHSDFSIYHGHRNMVWAYVKNMPNLLFWACLPFHLVMNITAVVWFVIKGQGSVILRAKRDALYGLPKMWHKRNQIQKKRSVSVRDIWRVLDKRIWPSRR